MEKKGKAKLFKKERITITAIASIIAPFISFVAVPMTVFGNNIQEFMFDWVDFVPMCLGFALLVSAAIFFAIIFLPEMAYKICLHILIAGDFLLFMQTTYFNENLSLMGDNISSGASFATKLFNIIFWFIVVVVFVVLAILKDKKKYIRTGALILCVVVAFTQLVSTVVPVLSNEKFFKPQAERVGRSKNELINVSTYKDVGEYSSTGNIYYFLIDMFDEKYAELAYNTDSTIYNELTGFTWYKDNLTMYGLTYPSIAYALTGVEHSAEWYNAEYMEKAYGGDNYLKELKNAGYKIKLYTDIGNAYGYAGLPDYVSNTHPAKLSNDVNIDRGSLFFNMLKLGLYVSAPLGVKNLVGDVTSEDFGSTSKIDVLDGYERYRTTNAIVKEHIDEIVFEETDEKQFTFFHVSGTHDVESSDQTQPTSVTGLLKLSFGMINVFLQNLKDKGLYDEATIVITGDHSFGYGYPAPTGLFFKPSQTEAESQETLKTSTAKVAQRNIMPSIFDSIGVTSEIAKAKGDKPLHLTDSTERNFVAYSWGVGFTETKYKVTGSLTAGGGPSSSWIVGSSKYYKNRRIYD